MIEMELNKIIINEKRNEQVIVLKEKSGARMLPIVIGLLEATAIKMELGGVQPPRPMTHDLLKNVFEALGLRLQRVVIDKLEANTFYAKLVVPTNETHEKQIDARPSDSIALAVRMKAPIFVEEEVLSKSEMFNIPEE
ncbi:bifunctional nuclease family protein [Thermoproteota archaeon]